MAIYEHATRRADVYSHLQGIPLKTPYLQALQNRSLVSTPWHASSKQFFPAAIAN